MKVLCIVQARMGSERLSGKVMKPILGQPMIQYTLDRIKRSKYVDEVILATSLQDAELPLVNYLKENHYLVFRGSEDNVLERYVQASKQYGGDIIIRVTGDCPLIDVNLLDRAIEKYNELNVDYVTYNVPHTMIRGFDIEIFSKESLAKVYQIVNQIEESSPYKEHVTLYMYRHEQEFSVYRIDGDELHRRNYRLCVDTKEDYQLVNHIFEYFKDPYVGSESVIQYLDEHPEIAAINNEIEQKHV